MATVQVVLIQCLPHSPQQVEVAAAQVAIPTMGLAPGVLAAVPVEQALTEQVPLEQPTKATQAVTAIRRVTAVEAAEQHRSEQTPSTQSLQLVRQEELA
jgi:hypothetical protein